MSVITFSESLGVTMQGWRQARQTISFRSAFGAQSIEPGHPLWQTTIERGKIISSSDEASAWMALLMRLRGGINQLAMWNKGRPVPRGTMRGEMVLAEDAAAGATTLVITGGYSQMGMTLLQGDFLGIGDGLTQQVVMVLDDATADSETLSLSLDFTTQTYGVGYPGQITVTIEPPLRNAFSAGEEVRWDKPKVLFRVQNDILGWDYENVVINGFSLELLEDWRP